VDCANPLGFQGDRSDPRFRANQLPLVMPKENSTTRFSDRVADYIRYRPQYPDTMIPALQAAIGLIPKMVVADIGAGTGISCVPFLENGNPVIAVEPNAEMRAAAVAQLRHYPKFAENDGTAENSGLADASVDVVFCGQAFHWFDPTAAKLEFQRILRPGGHVVLAWNTRNVSDPFQKGYEQLLLENVPEYAEVNHATITQPEMTAFFAPADFQTIELPNHQYFDAEGLKGRLLSASYCPKKGPAHEALMTGLGKLFEKFQQGGKVRFDYLTNLYHSQW
jgi:SAM-dependent methyltransferase